MPVPANCCCCSNWALAAMFACTFAISFFNSPAVIFRVAPVPPGAAVASSSSGAVGGVDVA
jgi:hypothetical protein